MAWHYDEPLGWFEDDETKAAEELPIFEQAWAEVFGGEAEDPDNCGGECGTQSISRVTDSGRHHKVERPEVG